MTALGIRRPGIYPTSEARYHNDPVREPSLSHSILRTGVTRSWRHARHDHPRLNPNFERKPPSDEMIEGSVIHWLILGRGARPKVIRFDNYLTKAAKEAKEAALQAGRPPVLAWKYAELRKCAAAALEQMKDHPGCVDFFGPGRSEQVLVWQEGPVWCRAMIDRLPDRPKSPVFDLKSTDKSAAPRDWERSIRELHATQAVHYMRGLAHLTRPDWGGSITDLMTTEPEYDPDEDAWIERVRPEREMRFIVIERKPPYAISVTAPGRTMLERAEIDVLRGVQGWARCMLTGEWPGYGKGIVRPELSWHQTADAKLARTANNSPLQVAA